MISAILSWKFIIYQKKKNKLEIDTAKTLHETETAVSDYMLCLANYWEASV